MAAATHLGRRGQGERLAARAPCPGRSIAMTRNSPASRRPVAPRRRGSAACRGRRRWPGRPAGRSTSVPASALSRDLTGHGRAPCWTANSAAWVRLARPSLARMFETCVRAVRSVMPSSSAIALFESPRATPAEDLALPAGQGREAGPSRRAAAAGGAATGAGPRGRARARPVAHAARHDPGDRRVEVDLAARPRHGSRPPGRRPRRP